MLEICAIASGSNGNCYYIGNENSAILIDAGISRKQILTRMEEKDLNPAKVRAVFISHEHSDHLRGAYVLGKRHFIPIYLSPGTYYAAYKNLKPDNPKFFNPGDVVQIDDFIVHSFLKNHDAAEPCSFRVEYENKSVGVFTDIGEPCELVESHLVKCNAVFLESNYDEKMLWEGKYPWFLKKRVASDNGHLSNKQAYHLLENYAGKNLECVFLSHLSQENNTPEKAYETVEPLSDKFKVKLTSRFAPAEVYSLL